MRWLRVSAPDRRPEVRRRRCFGCRVGRGCARRGEDAIAERCFDTQRYSHRDSKDRERQASCRTNEAWPPAGSLQPNRSATADRKAVASDNRDAVRTRRIESAMRVLSFQESQERCQSNGRALFASCRSAQRLPLSSVVSGPSPVSSRKTASNSAGSVALAFSLIVWCAPGTSLHVSPA